MAQPGADTGNTGTSGTTGTRRAAKPQNRRRGDGEANTRGTDPDRTTEPSRSSAHDAEPTVGIEERTSPSTDEIAMRAYEIYLARGRSDGQDLDDWLRAEQELGIRNS